MHAASAEVLTSLASCCVHIYVGVLVAQVIRTNTQLRRPSGILWHKLSPQKLGQIRVLRELKQRIEQETGQTLPTGVWQQPSAQ